MGRPKGSKNLTQKEKDRLKSLKSAFGSPTKFREEHCKKIVELAESKVMVDYVVQCCKLLNISRDTFNHWCHCYPCFSDAYSKGRVIWKCKLDDFLVQGGMSYQSYKTSYFQGTQKSCEPADKVEQSWTLADPKKLQAMLADADKLKPCDIIND